jgi:hypothetical protein
MEKEVRRGLLARSLAYLLLCVGEGIGVFCLFAAEAFVPLSIPPLLPSVLPGRADCT